jgi:DNA-binding response OmpR family regulator
LAIGRRCAGLFRWKAAMALMKGSRRIRRPEDLERVSILAIESIQSMIGTLSGVLRSFRFQAVQVMGNSEEALFGLSTRTQLKADIIVIDWKAHPLDCEEFVRKLRRIEIPEVAEVPVIAFIANADRETVFAARDCGVNAVLLRPFSATQLMEKVISALGQDTPFVRTEVYVGPDRRRFRTAEYLGEKRRYAELNDGEAA